VILVVASLFGCATPPPKPASQAVAPDNWQKIKECAEQADKVAADYQRRRLPMGAVPGSKWANHYSAKENRCFMELWYTTVGNDRSSSKVRNVMVHEIQDAFDQKTIATWADNGFEIDGTDLQCCVVM
jgi:hypothetical protein